MPIFYVVIMKNLLVKGASIRILFDVSTCTFAQSNKQDKAPLLPEIAYKKPKKEVKKINSFQLEQLTEINYTFNKSHSQKKRYNRKVKQQKYF